jgi:ubiquinone biosynthesis protein COQ4
VRWGRRTPGFWRRFRVAFRRGRRARPLATFRWEDHWSEPVATLREELACPPEETAPLS